MATRPEARHAVMPSHELSAAGLDHADRLMVFNWLVAAHAHRDWLGSWAHLLEPRDKVEMRLLRRASIELLERQGLEQRYLKTTNTHAWLLLPPNLLEPVAQELGVAMLGGWVRNGLERRQVAQQLRVLSKEQRGAAMRYATSLKALPFSMSGSGWPMPRLDPSSVFELGASCMAGLLTDDSDGSRDRFSMRFARGQVIHLELSDAQRDEATALIHRHTKLALQLQRGQS